MTSTYTLVDILSRALDGDARCRGLDGCGGAVAATRSAPMTTSGAALRAEVRELRRSCGALSPTDGTGATGRPPYSRKGEGAIDHLPYAV